MADFGIPGIQLGIARSDFDPLVHQPISSINVPEEPMAPPTHQDGLLALLTGLFGVISGFAVYLILHFCYRFREPIWAYLFGRFTAGRVAEVEVFVRVRSDTQTVAEIQWRNYDVERNSDLVETRVLPGSNNSNAEGDQFHDCVSADEE